MKAIILSAGQGTRLLPMTEQTPKCLLPLAGGTNILRWQLDQLEEAGIKETIVVTGFHADKVCTELAMPRAFMKTKAVYNPFFKVADNLGSVWIARQEMTEDFILLNGDTLFTTDVVQRLIANAHQPITVTVAYKDRYDSDDMKVTLKDEGIVHSIGKTIDMSNVDAESIGMIMFRNHGSKTFREAVETVMMDQTSLKRYYLSVIDMLAKGITIGTAEALQEEWCEVDFPLDFERAQKAITNWQSMMSPSIQGAVTA